MGSPTNEVKLNKHRVRQSSDLYLNKRIDDGTENEDYEEW